MILVTLSTERRETAILFLISVLCPFLTVKRHEVDGMNSTGKYIIYGAALTLVGNLIGRRRFMSHLSARRRSLRDLQGRIRQA